MGTYHDCMQCGGCNEHNGVRNDSIYRRFPTTIEEYDECVKNLWDITPNGPNLIINLTNDCPLRCTYCFMDFAKQDMRLETLDLFLTRLLSGFYGPKITKPPTLTFFGGEPLMQYDNLIVPIVEKFKDKFNWTVTTNGVLLTKERIDFFKKHEFSVLLSIDGAPQTQNCNRPFEDGAPSSQPIEDVLPYLIQNFPNTTFRATLIPETSHLLGENILYALNNGFNSFFCCPNEFSDWYCEENSNKIKEAAQTIGAHYLYCFANKIQPLRISHLDRILQHLVLHEGKPNIYSNWQFPVRCGMGVGGWGIGVDGTIFGCQEKNSQGESIFKIGDINGLDKEKHLHLLKTYSKSFYTRDRQECDECIARSFCSDNICPSRQIDLAGKFDPTVEKANCIFKKEVFQVALELIEVCSLSPELSVTFQEYLGHLRRSVNQ